MPRESVPLDDVIRSMMNHVIPYTIIGSYSFLYTFTLNVIINTRFSKESTNPATNAAP